jgi:hypothetical protein
MNNLQCLIFVALAAISAIGAIWTYKPAPPPPTLPVHYLVSYIGESKSGRTFIGRSVRYYTRIVDLQKLIEETEAALIESNKSEDCVKIVITGMSKLEKYP